MVNPSAFKQNIANLLSQEYSLEFLGKNFEILVPLISESKADRIYVWIKEIVARGIQPILVHSDKPYKNWRAYELLTFRHAFSLQGHEYRILLVKVKNSVYIEFHLGDHKYYDSVRKELGL